MKRSAERISIMVTGSFTQKVNEIEVVSTYGYMAAPATIWDAELIAWANRRDAELKRPARAHR